MYQRVLEMFRENRRNSFRHSINQNNRNYNDVNGANQAVNNPSEIEEAENVNNYFRYYNKDLRLDEMERSLIDQVSFIFVTFK